jgi:membrane-anchored glycerophosphoryl diester phosphodiesterase (GDPDase)
MTIESMINDIFKKSWDIFKKNYVSLILAALIAMLLGIFIITAPPLMFGLYMMCLDLMKGKKVKVSDVFNGFNHFWLSLGIAVLAGLAILAGLVLLVIPGLLLMVLWQFTVPIALTEKRGVIGSLGRSWDIAKQHFAFSVMLFLIVFAINAIGGLTRIGTLVTLPFITLVIAEASGKLSAMTPKKAEKKEPATKKKKPAKK